MPNSVRNKFRMLSAILAWTTLIVQYILVLRSGEHSGFGAATISYFGYFTILTNILVAVAFTVPFLSSNNRFIRFFEKPPVRAAIALYILVVAVVYHTMLRNLWEPQGWQLATDIALHSLLPVLYLLDWFCFAKKRPMALRHIPFWVVYPVIYGLFTMVKGLMTGIYPYPFLNVTELGLGGVLVNMAGFAGLYAFGAAAFITAAWYFPKQKSPAISE